MNFGSNHGIASESHKRAFSASGVVIGPSLSTAPNGSNSRPSLDAESNIDDDTSYDSTSQFSIDQNIPSMEFYLENGGDSNQVTMNSINNIKQNMYLQNQHYQEFTSFETIKKVLYNGNTAPSNGGSQVAGSGLGVPQATNTHSTSGISSRSVTQMNNDNLDDHNSDNSDTLDNSLRIISDFKQKPFDELKQTLLKTHQTHLNPEKYQQVFDLISKELTVSTQSNSRDKESNLMSNLINNPNNNSNGSVNTSNGNLYNGMNSVSNLSTISNPSNSIGSSIAGGVLKETYQQKMIPLNDIDFPQLFMY